MRYKTIQRLAKNVYVKWTFNAKLVERIVAEVAMVECWLHLFPVSDVPGEVHLWEMNAVISKYIMLFYSRYQHIQLKKNT